VHAAANSGRNTDDPETLFRDNVVATRSVLEFAKRSSCPRIVYLSSVSIHGRVEGTVLDSATPIRSPGVYGRTKFEAEQVLAADQEVGVIVLRLPGVLGLGAPEHWIGSLAARASRGDPLIYVNPDGLFNNVVDVDELATFVADLIERASWPSFDAFPLASRDPITVLETVTLIRDMFGGRSEVVSLGERLPHFVIDDSRARREYGYRSSTTAQSLLRFAQMVRGER
jgi:nucleoside-diphosphate-sugar epimerase